VLCASVFGRRTSTPSAPCSPPWSCSSGHYSLANCCCELARTPRLLVASCAIPQQRVHAASLLFLVGFVWLQRPLLGFLAVCSCFDSIVVGEDHHSGAQPCISCWMPEPGVATPSFSSNRIVVPTRRCRHLPPHCCWSAILLSSCSLRLCLYVLAFDHRCNLRSLSEEVEPAGRLLGT
jgi:hypothetical protein